MVDAGPEPMCVKLRVRLGRGSRNFLQGGPGQSDKKSSHVFFCFF